MVDKSKISVNIEEMSEIKEICEEPHENTSALLNLDNIHNSSKSRLIPSTQKLNLSNNSKSPKKTKISNNLSPNNFSNLKFNYNAGSFKNQVPANKFKFNKGFTLGENAINKLLQKHMDNGKNNNFPLGSNVNLLKSRDNESSNSNMSENTGGLNKPPRRRKKSGLSGLNGKMNSIRLGRKKLKRYKTFQSEMNEKVVENYLANRLSNVTNLNIHININQVNSNNVSNINNINQMRRSNDHIVEESENVYSPIESGNKKGKKFSRRKSEKMWGLCKKAIKMAKGFTEHNVTKIEYPGDLVENIEEYRKQKERVSPRREFIIANNPSLHDFMKKSEMDKELIRVNLKESALKVITEGCKNFRQELDRIFEKNLERFLIDQDSPNFLFNQPLPDTKRTLLYTACQDGNLQIVSYFLEKGLNPSIPSKTDENEYENCLDVAARWNYPEIVELLIQNGKIKEHEIRNLLAKQKLLNLKKGIVKLLNDYLNQKYAGKPKKKGCACF